MKNSTNAKPLTATSRYNGVSKSKSKSARKNGFEAKFLKHWLGSYVLEVDAALAYDGAVRGLRAKEHFSKINFKTEKCYRDARKKELAARGLTVDLEETLAFISKVKDVVSKSASHAQA